MVVCVCVYVVHNILVVYSSDSTVFYNLVAGVFGLFLGLTASTFITFPQADSLLAVLAHLFNHVDLHCMDVILAVCTVCFSCEFTHSDDRVILVLLY